MNILTKVWLYIKNYFTVSIYRKVFLYCVLIGIAVFVLSFTFGLEAGGIVAYIFFTGAVFVTMIETMSARNGFCKKVSQMKIEHYKKLIEEGGSETDVLMNPVFSPDEELYINRKKKVFVFVILGKVLIIILLFALIFGQVNIIL